MLLDCLENADDHVSEKVLLPLLVNVSFVEAVPSTSICWHSSGEVPSSEKGQCCLEYTMSSSAVPNFANPYLSSPTRIQ